MIFKKIPGKLNNRTLVGVIDRLRKIEKHIKRNFAANDKANKEAYLKMVKIPGHMAYLPAGVKSADVRPESVRLNAEESLKAADGAGDKNEHPERDIRSETLSLGLIERQSELKDMSLGKSTLDYSGCEVIAVYNLLLMLNGGSHIMTLPELIEIFEKDGILYAGRFGVSPRSIVSFLSSRGIEVNFTTDESDFDVLGNYLDHFILTVMNDKDDIFRQIHTFYINKVGDHFIAHNAGLRMRYFSISEIIKALPGGNAKGICLIAVKETFMTD